MGPWSTSEKLSLALLILSGVFFFVAGGVPDPFLFEALALVSIAVAAVVRFSEAPRGKDSPE